MTEPDLRPFRSLFFLSVLLIGVGSCGSVSGLVEMQVDPFLPVQSAEEGDNEKERQAQLLVVDAIVRSPYRKPVAAADAIVSMLLLWSGIALFRRRKTASWWVTQATLANGLMVVVEAITQWLAIDSRWEEIVGVDPDVGIGAANAALTTLAVTTAARLGLYLWILYRIRRPDVRAALATE